MPDAIVEAALAALQGPRLRLEEARRRVPALPGLYSFYGTRTAFAQLGLEDADTSAPLYVGKAERSLNGRDVSTHFAAGRTGSSTVRRSLAALLVDRLELVAVPRNLERPDGSANFALEPEGDARLSAWMAEHLLLATWVAEADVTLARVEALVLGRMQPPLNLTGVAGPRDGLREARARMAERSRSWPA